MYRLTLLTDLNATVDLRSKNFDTIDDFIDEAKEVVSKAKSGAGIKIAISQPLSGLSIPQIFRRLVTTARSKNHEIEILVPSADALEALYRFLPKEDQLVKGVDLGTLLVNIRLADICDVLTEAIVNASNTRLELGGGVSGSIAKLAGPSLQPEMSALAKPGIVAGQVVMTSAHRMPYAKYILHAACADGKPETIRLSVQNIFTTAKEKGISDVAIPALGAGTGGLPIKDCAKIMLTEIKSLRDRDLNISIVLWTKSDFDIFVATAEELK